MVRNKPGPNLSDLRRRCPLAIHGRESTSEGTACCSRSQSQNARAFSKQQSMHVFSPTARAVETTDRSSSSETGTYRYRPDPRHRRCWRPRCRNKDRVGACLVRRLLEVADGASHASCWPRAARKITAARVAGVGGDPFGASGTRCDGSRRKNVEESLQRCLLLWIDAASVRSYWPLRHELGLAVNENGIWGITEIIDVSIDGTTRRKWKQNGNIVPDETSCAWSEFWSNGAWRDAGGMDTAARAATALLAPWFDAGHRLCPSLTQKINASLFGLPQLSTVETEMAQQPQLSSGVSTCDGEATETAAG
jgi:hypothetical protein